MFAVGSRSKEAFETDQCTEALDAGQAGRGLCKYDSGYLEVKKNLLLISALEN